MTLELYLTLLSVIALTAVTVAVIGLFVIYRGVDHFGTMGLISLIFWTLAISNCLTIAASARVYSEYSFAFGDHSSIHPLVNWLLRAVKMGLQGTAGIALMLAMIRRGFPKGGAMLIGALTLLYLSIAASAAFGYKFYYSDHLINIFLLLLAIIVSEPANPEKVARHFKVILAAILYATLILAAIDPHKYFQSNYSGLIPGLTYRLHGLAVHANSMAPIAVAYLILVFWVPAKKIFEIPTVIVAALILLLTQSKTNWVAAAMVLVFFVLFRFVRKLLLDIRGSEISAVSILGSITIFGAIFLMALKAPSLLDPDRLGDLLGFDLHTLTGRSTIWQITYETWQRYPWFGYGPNLWNTDFRLTTGFLAAGDAHSQFMQTLGETGLFGLFAWLVYVIVLLHYAARFNGRTHGAMLAFVLFMLFRGISEVTFKLGLLFDMNVMLHMMLIVLMLMLARSEPQCSTVRQQSGKSAIRPTT